MREGEGEGMVGKEGGGMKSGTVKKGEMMGNWS